MLRFCISHPCCGKDIDVLSFLFCESTGITCFVFLMLELKRKLGVCANVMWLFRTPECIVVGRDKCTIRTHFFLFYLFNILFFFFGAFHFFERVGRHFVCVPDKLEVLLCVVFLAPH